MANSEETKPSKPGKRSNKRSVVIGIVLLLAIACGLFYFLWFRPKMRDPLAEALELEEVNNGTLTQEEKPLQTENPNLPICGDVDELLILVVGIDYRGANYLYGLADAVRIVHVDFTTPQINVVALPRALLIEDPGEHLDVEGPLLLNQSYLFGSSGMGHFEGSGYGAGALAETIQANFGLSVDNYLVVDFAAFQNFIYLIDGVKINLPEPIYINESDNPYFPAGVQYLDGEQALQLARARAYTSDNVRIDNQTLLLKAIIQRLQEPEVLLNLPQLVDTLEAMALTDASPRQIQSAICLLDKIDAENIQFYNPDTDLIEDERAFIPTMDKEMNIFLWDQTLTDWLFDSLWSEPET